MKILISAYACESGKGSEPGVGWNWSLAAAQKHEVWVLTRANNQLSIEQALAESPQPSLHFVYLDLPAWALAWKRGPLGIRIYYVIWQLIAARTARRLHHEEAFDIVHHLTFANFSLPALICLADVPFVLGPVGGGQKVPLPLYPVLGVRGVAAELLTLGARWLMRLNPLVRIGWSRAAVILVNNEETRLALPRRVRSKALLRPNACVAAMKGERTAGAPDRVAVYCGRLHRFKGVSLAIRVLVLLPTWRLLIVGDGPDGRRLRKIASRSGVADRVQFYPWLPQQELWKKLAACRTLLFPSLKEGAPSVIAEAQALGIPVVGFNRGGVAALATVPGTRFRLVTPGSPDESIRRLAAALRTFEEDDATPPSSPDFGPAAVARDIDAAYARARAAL